MIEKLLGYKQNKMGSTSDTEVKYTDPNKQLLMELKRDLGMLSDEELAIME